VDTVEATKIANALECRPTIDRGVDRRRHGIGPERDTPLSRGGGGGGGEQEGDDVDSRHGLTPDYFKDGCGRTSR
jgi:hypothetical protein